MGKNLCFWATLRNDYSEKKMNAVVTAEVFWVKREKTEEQIFHNYENTSAVFSSHESRALRDIRVFLLWVFVLLGLLGNSMMLSWLWTHRKQQTRIVRLFGNLASADVLVNLCGTLPLLVLEYLRPAWPAGEILCKIFHFLLEFSCCASNYMIVPIPFDRCKAVKRPLAFRTKCVRRHFAYYNFFECMEIFRFYQRKPIPFFLCSPLPILLSCLSCFLFCMPNFLFFFVNRPKLEEEKQP
ncbi:N-formyl peptide receptor 2-like [Tachypleus tridentatus]|uniref:N-formyl peptide receptor 2-like n=1 Tax=Tachypleus tridentatus TaxID=6853 RepID=UPI003FCFCD72